MKAITTKEKLPKFLEVNAEAPSKPWNKYLLKPYEKGEIVKVAPFEEQVSQLLNSSAKDTLLYIVKTKKANGR